MDKEKEVRQSLTEVSVHCTFYTDVHNCNNSLLTSASSLLAELKEHN